MARRGFDVCRFGLPLGAAADSNRTDLKQPGSKLPGSAAGDPVAQQVDHLLTQEVFLKKTDTRVWRPQSTMKRSCDAQVSIWLASCQRPPK